MKIAAAPLCELPLEKAWAIQCLPLSKAVQYTSEEVDPGCIVRQGFLNSFMSGPSDFSSKQHSQFYREKRCHSRCRNWLRKVSLLYLAAPDEQAGYLNHCLSINGTHAQSSEFSHQYIIHRQSASEGPKNLYKSRCQWTSSGMKQ